MPVSPLASGLPSALADALARNVSAHKPAAPTAPAPASPGVVTSFSSALDTALRAVSGAQHQAGELAQAFIADPQAVGLEDAMVAMQKAQIGFQSALHVRNRLVSAYTDIMNMQV